ncbi:LysR family transcriptional regulator [Leisingera sp. D0M16]|uniref:LysR family transcriptional regulator n=1 Tax=Leisingera coralii TaxID=3351347 RepID=UPI003B828EBB
MNGLPPLSGTVIFVEIADTGAFNEAARRLDMTASAASKAITRLEEDLGVKLLHRTTRSVSLTPEGERFLEGVRPLLRDFTALREEMTNAIATPSGRLVVSAPAAFGRLALIPLLPQFRDTYPEVDLELRLEDRLADLIGDTIDVAIRAGALADSATLIARKLFDDQLVTCASPAYLDKHGAPLEIEDLDRHECLSFRNDATKRPAPWLFLRDGATFRHSPKGQFSCSDGQGVALAAQAGMGISQMPAYMAKSALNSGELIEVLSAFRPPSTPFHAVFLDRRLMPSRVRVFVDFLANALTT